MINQILNYLQKFRGIDFTGNRVSMLQRRIAKRLFATNSKTYEEYLEFLNNNPDELDKLLSSLTINVSSFFRDPLVWETLYKSILPVLLYNKAETDEIRIWSAGCAAGEEPYTMAILVKEFLEKEKRALVSHIFATDIDHKIINKAELGSYSLGAVENIKLGLVKKYFHLTQNLYKIDTEIKKMVNFSYFDLLDGKKYSPPGSIFGEFDLVLCRNVLIYFNQKFQKKIFEKLYRSLNTGGYLILGESEILSSNLKDKFVQVNDCCKIFQKRK